MSDAFMLVEQILMWFTFPKSKLIRRIEERKLDPRFLSSFQYQTLRWAISGPLNCQVIFLSTFHFKIHVATKCVRVHSINSSIFIRIYYFGCTTLIFFLTYNTELRCWNVYPVAIFNSALLKLCRHRFKRNWITPDGYYLPQIWISASVAAHVSLLLSP